jgi:hypothetical protein
MYNLERLATYGTQDEGAIQTWTIQRNWQHRIHKTKGQSNMDNPEKLAT